MINPEHLDHFVARFMAALPEKFSDRKEDLVTLLCLLPKDYPRRKDIVKALEALRAHEQTQLIVILGNPPYNGFAGLAVEEERDLSNAYRTTKHAPAPQGQGLNDLYIRFFRMAVPLATANRWDWRAGPRTNKSSATHSNSAACCLRRPARAERRALPVNFMNHEPIEFLPVRDWNAEPRPTLKSDVVALCIGVLCGALGAVTGAVIIINCLPK